MHMNNKMTFYEKKTYINKSIKVIWLIIVAYTFVNIYKNKFYFIE
jgi:hypothetical protein